MNKLFRTFTNLTKRIMIFKILCAMSFSSILCINGGCANGDDPYNYGAMDSSIPIIEKSIKNGDSNEVDTYEGIVLMNGFSTEGIQRLLNDGFLLGYLEQIKAKGLISQSFVPKSATTSSKSKTASTKTSKTPTTPKTSKHTHS